MKVDYKYFVATIVCAVAVVAWTLSNNTAPLPPPTVQAPLSPSEKLIAGMIMTFDDEFDTFNQYLDASGNVTCSPNATGTWQTIYYNCSHTTAPNNEAQWYLASSTKAFDGILTIEAMPSTNQPLPYTSGIITTQYSFSQTYGYFEIRAQVPAGRGLWPAFWLLPVDISWPPEIDVMETFGETNPINGEGGRTVIHYASHLPPYNETCGAWYDTHTDVTTAFHTYGVDWEPDSITYYFDGVPYATCPSNPAANKPFYMIVNLAVGALGSWPGATDASTTLPAYLRVDYVRAYQKR